MHVMLRVPHEQAVNYRLAVNNLSRRLPAGSYVEAAYAGLQDTAPRFDLIAGELTPVDLAVRLLVLSDLRLFGQDRTQLFVGPGKNDHSRLQDSFHPNGLMLHGCVIGAWGRRGGQVNIKAAGPLAPSIRDAIHAEAVTMPIPGKEITVSLTEH
jgi:hypothetical protein